MPELPEVQALAERLTEAVGGSVFEGAVPLQFSSLKTVTPRVAELEGRTLGAVGRRGKYLLFELAGPRILVHLSQGGRIDVEEPPKTTKPRGAVVRFRFANGTTVLVKEFGRERKAGWWVLAEGDDGPLAKLGPEPDSREFEQLVRVGRGRQARPHDPPRSTDGRGHRPGLLGRHPAPRQAVAVRRARHARGRASERRCSTRCATCSRRPWSRSGVGAVDCRPRSATTSPSTGTTASRAPCAGATCVVSRTSRTRSPTVRPARRVGRCWRIAGSLGFSAERPDVMESSRWFHYSFR